MYDTNWHCSVINSFLKSPPENNDTENTVAKSEFVCFIIYQNIKES